MRRLQLGFAFCAAFLIGGAFAQETAPTAKEQADAERAESLAELLSLVRAGELKERSINADRLRRFQQNSNEQSQLVTQGTAELRRQEVIAREREATINRNKQTISDREELLKERLGALNEMFGHLRSAAGDARSSFETSLTRGQFGKGREEFVTALSAQMAEGQALPEIEQLERFWYELQKEMVASGRIESYPALVAGPSGAPYQCDVVRVGLYNVLCDNKYLIKSYTSLANYQELPRQPDDRYVRSAGKLTSAQSGEYTRFGVDPTGPQGGNLLALLITTPSIEERVDQGGIVGYLILTLGGIAVFLAIYKLIQLSLVGRGIKAQLRSDKINEKNPLGRILKVADDAKNEHTEALELRLAEQILTERPTIERFVGFIKIIGVIAPLMGLLGTVTGMIITFQQITLFGTGDPKTMAGGISTALITTVLGLVVAIPTVLLHSVVHGRVRSIVHVLEEESTGMVAERAEQMAELADAAGKKTA